MEPNSDISIINSLDEALFVCLDNCQREQPADSTYRLAFEPEPAQGHDFEPFDVPHREPRFQQLPPTRLLLFQAFIPICLVESWVKYTNNGPAPGLAGLAQRKLRKRKWKPTSVAEIYLWLTIKIYIGFHKESSIIDPLKTSLIDRLLPVHPRIW